MKKLMGRPPKLTPSDRDRVIFLRTVGVHPRKIAEMYRIDLSTVYDYIRGEHKNPRLRSEP